MQYKTHLTFWFNRESKADHYPSLITWFYIPLCDRYFIYAVIWMATNYLQVIYYSNYHYFTSNRNFYLWDMRYLYIFIMRFIKFIKNVTRVLVNKLVATWLNISDFYASANKSCNVSSNFSRSSGSMTSEIGSKTITRYIKMIGCYQTCLVFSAQKLTQKLPRTKNDTTRLIYWNPIESFTGLVWKRTGHYVSINTLYIRYL